MVSFNHNLRHHIPAKHSLYKPLNGMCPKPTLVIVLLSLMTLCACQQIKTRAPLHNEQETSAHNNINSTDVQVLQAQRLHSKAVWLRQEIIYLQWQLNESPRDPLVYLKLKQRQAQARALVRSVLRVMYSMNDNDQSQAITRYGPVLLTLAPKAFLSTLSPEATFNNLAQDGHDVESHTPDTQSDLSALTSSGLTPVLNSPQLAKSFEAALTRYVVQQREPVSTLPASPTPVTAAEQDRPSKHHNQSADHRTDQLEAAMREGNLAELQQQLKKFDTDEALPLSTQLRVRALSAFLQQQIALLQEQADNLYQQGKLTQAQALWQKLLVLNPEDAQLKAKILRVQTVLQNMEQLRQEQP